VNSTSADLQGLRVFVAEDEFLVLMLVEDMLATLGCTVAATAAKLGEATRIARETEIDVAILDVNLGGEKIFPVAEALAARGIPMVFSTGYGNAGLEPKWAGRPVLQKPYQLDQLKKALEGLAAARKR
jgi:CheY-like chemotaxis protein